MPLGERIVQLHGFQGSRFGFRHRLPRAQYVDADRAEERIGIGQAGVRWRIARILGDGALKILDASLDICR